MCRKNGRRCRHDAQRDRERRKAMKTYRADLGRAAVMVTGPAVAQVIATAPTGALPLIALELGLDPVAVSAVVPAARTTHDAARTLRELQVARAADRAGVVDVAAVLNYQRQRGYTPLHPLPTRMTEPRDLEALHADYRNVAVHSAGEGLSDCGLPASVAELGAVEADRALRRQEIADLFVGRARQERADAGDAEQWATWTAAEQESMTAVETHYASGGKGVRRISFVVADGNDLTLSAPAAAKVADAYGRLSASSVDVRFFTTHSDAVLAHGVHIGRCDTPAEAVGVASWQGYLDRAKGDEQTARRAVAADAATVFAYQGESEFATRATVEQATEVSDGVDVTVQRWGEDVDAAWKQVPTAAIHQTVSLDALLRDRRLIFDGDGDPFEPSDAYSTSSGGVYGSEMRAAEELTAALRQLHGGRDELAATVADAIAEQAHAARKLPTTTLAQRTERQWRLAELVDAATTAVESPDAIRDVTVLAPVHPDQMELIDLQGARS